LAALRHGGQRMQLLRMGLAVAAVLGVTALGACGNDGTPESIETSTTSAPTPNLSTSVPSSTGVTRSPSASSSPRATATNAEVGPEKGFSTALFGQSTVVDNRWFPMKPGTQFIYEGHTIEEGERIAHRAIFTVTDLTKVIAGVRNVVVWDRDYTAGKLEETELAFFAQAKDGMIWHFGQYPEVYEEGSLVETPAWIHGIRGARAGITIKPDSRLGEPSYSQGWGPAVGWSDRARVHKTGQKTCVRAGCYSDVLITDEFSLDEPGAHQLKYYAPGVGPVQVGWLGNDPTKETLELVKITRSSPRELAALREQALKLERNAYRLSKDVYAHTAPMEKPR
jgi:hypothetical protein